MRIADFGVSRLGSLRTAAVATAVVALALGIATPAFGAQKINKADFARFVDCPIPAADACAYDETLSGEFKMGTRTVPIVNPVVLQGGFAGFMLTTTELLPMIGPRFGAEAVSKTSQPVPGGLTGLTELIGGPVNATAELAGPVSGIKLAPWLLNSRKGVGIEFPIKVHLENPTLGPNCYVGSDSDPIMLDLTDGVTEPPPFVKPIEGKKGTLTGFDKGRITEFVDNTVVDNTFAVPAATDCGLTPLLVPVITPLVNLISGLPSPPGQNKAELTGNLYVGEADWVAKYDKKLIRAKEKAEKPKR